MHNNVNLCIPASHIRFTRIKFKNKIANATKNRPVENLKLSKLRVPAKSIHRADDVCTISKCISPCSCGNAVQLASRQESFEHSVITSTRWNKITQPALFAKGTSAGFAAVGRHPRRIRNVSRQRKGVPFSREHPAEFTRLRCAPFLSRYCNGSERGSQPDTRRLDFR